MGTDVLTKGVDPNGISWLYSRKEFICSISLNFLVSLLPIIALQYPYFSNLSWYNSMSWEVYPSLNSGVCTMSQKYCYYYNDGSTWYEADRENKLNCLQSHFRGVRSTIRHVHRLLTSNAALAWLASALGIWTYLNIHSVPTFNSAVSLTRRREVLFTLCLTGSVYSATMLATSVSVLSLLGQSPLSDRTMWAPFFPACNEVVIRNGPVFWTMSLQILVVALALVVLLRTAMALYATDQFWRSQIVHRDLHRDKHTLPSTSSLAAMESLDQDAGSGHSSDSLISGQQDEAGAGAGPVDSEPTLPWNMCVLRYQVLSFLHFLWRFRRQLLGATAGFTVFTLTVVCLDTSYYGRLVYDATFNYPRTDVFDRHIHRIAFIGDSLCPNKQATRDIMQSLSRARPHEIWVPIRGCVGGSTISIVRQRMMSQALRYAPDAILLYWDSDASDVDEGPTRGLENHSVPSEQLRVNFVQDLRAVLHACLRVTRLVAVMGPTLLGEKPRGTNGRDALTEVYLQMIANTTAELNVAYVNMRDVFFSSLPVGWDHHSGYLTEDGEHPNDTGVAITVNEYKKILQKWFG